MAHPPETLCVFYINMYSRVADELCGFHMSYSRVAGDIRFPADVGYKLLPTFKPHHNCEGHPPATVLHACSTFLYKFQLFAF